MFNPSWVECGVTLTCTALLCVEALEQHHPTLPADGQSFRFRCQDRRAPTWMYTRHVNLKKT